MQRLAAAFERGEPASSLGLKEEEEKAIRSFQLLTLKPELVLVNIGDERIGQPLPPALLARPAGRSRHRPNWNWSCKISPRKIAKRSCVIWALRSCPGTRSCGRSTPRMGLIVFFTVGEDECRAWGLAKGANAVEGAAQIHTDLARGFVRAEVVRFEDFQRRRLHEGSQDPWRLPLRRQKLRRAGRRYYACFGEHVVGSRQ